MFLLLTNIGKRTADSPLILLDHLQQLHAGSLDGVENLRSHRKTVMAGGIQLQNLLHAIPRAESCSPNGKIKKLNFMCKTGGVLI